MNREALLRQGMRWNVYAGLGSFASLFLFLPMGVAAIGLEAYGVWLLCISGSALLSQADFGLATGVTRRVAVERGAGTDSPTSTFRITARSYFRRLGLLGGVLQASLLSIYFATTSAGRPVSPTELLAMITLSSVSLTANLICRYHVACLHAYQRHDIERKAALGFTLIRGAGLLVIMATPLSVLSLVALEAVVFCAPSLWACLRSFKEGVAAGRLSGTSIDSAAGRELLRFGAPVFMSGFSALLAVTVPLYIVGSLIDPAGVVLYAACIRLYNGGKLAVSWLYSPALPLIAQLHASGATEDMTRLIEQTAKRCLSLAAVAAVWIAVLQAVILEIWLGVGGFASSASIALVGLGLLGLALAWGPPFATASGTPGAGLFTNILWLCSSLILILPLSDRFGVTGSVASLMLTYLALAPFAMRRALSAIGQSWPLTRASHALLVGAGCIVSLASFTPPRESVNLLSVGFALIFTLVAWLHASPRPWTIPFRLRIRGM